MVRYLVVILLIAACVKNPAPEMEKDLTSTMVVTPTEAPQKPRVPHPDWKLGKCLCENGSDPWMGTVFKIEAIGEYSYHLSTYNWAVKQYEFNTEGVNYYTFEPIDEYGFRVVACP